MLPSNHKKPARWSCCPHGFMSPSKLSHMPSLHMCSMVPTNSTVPERFAFTFAPKLDEQQHQGPEQPALQHRILQLTCLHSCRRCLPYIKVHQAANRCH